MKLIMTYDPETEMVFQEFEQTKVVKVYEIEDGEIVHSELVGTMAEGVEDIISLILLMDADGVLCGEIRPETRALLDEEGVVYYSGFDEKADDAVDSFINGYVVFGPDD